MNLISKVSGNPSNVRHATNNFNMFYEPIPMWLYILPYIKVSIKYKENYNIEFSMRGSKGLKIVMTDSEGD